MIEPCRGFKPERLWPVGKAVENQFRSISDGKRCADACRLRSHCHHALAPIGHIVGLARAKAAGLGLPRLHASFTTPPRWLVHLVTRTPNTLLFAIPRS